MSNIEISPEEVQETGEKRWTIKHGMRLPSLLFAGGLASVGGMWIASKQPDKPVGFLIALIVGVVIIIGYAHLIRRPARKAGVQFLKDCKEKGITLGKKE
jgi:hypothetical protein